MNENKKNVILAKNHDIVVQEETRSIEIGGTDVNYKHFVVEQSKEMETYLNQQSIIKAAGPRVNQVVIDDAMKGLKSLMSSNSSGKKMMKALSGPIMSLFVSPNADLIFNGPCDSTIDKKVCTGAVMQRIQKEIPAVIPSLFMDNFFDDDEETDTGGKNTTGNAGDTPNDSPLTLL
jgi:hypothetical protein